MLNIWKIGNFLIKNYKAIIIHGASLQSAHYISESALPQNTTLD